MRKNPPPPPPSPPPPISGAAGQQKGRWKSLGEVAKQKPWAERYPLHRAACNIDGAGIRELVLRGVEDLNQIDEEGRAPLHYAAWNGLDVPTRELLEANAMVDVRSGDRQSTPLHFAAGMGHLRCARLLLEHGASKIALDCDKWQPMDLAKQNLTNSEDSKAIAELCRPTAPPG